MMGEGWEVEVDWGPPEAAKKEKEPPEAAKTGVPPL